MSNSVTYNVELCIIDVADGNVFYYHFDGIGSVSILY